MRQIQASRSVTDRTRKRYAKYHNSHNKSKYRIQSSISQPTSKIHTKYGTTVLQIAIGHGNTTSDFGVSRAGTFDLSCVVHDGKKMEKLEKEYMSRTKF